MEILRRDLDFQFHAATNEGTPNLDYYQESRVEVSIILDGSVMFIADGRRYVADAPCATLQVYRDYLRVLPNTSDYIRTMWCHFTPERLSTEDWALLRTSPQTQPMPAMLPTLFAGAMMLQNREATDPKSNLARNVLNSLGKTILAEYFRSAQDYDARSRLPIAVQRAKDALDERYLYPWTVDKLAQIAGMNANYLIHLFKAHLGLPPIHYLWERRLNVGIHALQTTGLSIEEISFRCGFQSAAHFSRRVKQKTGLSPILLRLKGL